MTSTHTSFAAARAPARLPSAALLQIPSTLPFRLADSVGALLTTALHSATAAASSAALTGPLGTVLALGVAGVDDDDDVAAGVLDVVLAAAAGAVAVEPLVVELLLLPQPEISAAQSSAPANSGDRLAIIGPPCIEKTLACAERLVEPRLAGRSAGE
jgi:hypothetical protein